MRAGSNVRICGASRPRKEERNMAKGSKGSGKKGSGSGNPYHSAKTGKFVSEKYAKSHPSTTFKESPRKK